MCSRCWGLKTEGTSCCEVGLSLPASASSVKQQQLIPGTGCTKTRLRRRVFWESCGRGKAVAAEVESPRGELRSQSPGWLPAAWKPKQLISSQIWGQEVESWRRVESSKWVGVWAVGWGNSIAGHVLNWLSHFTRAALGAGTRCYRKRQKS